MVQISPSVLAADFGRLADELRDIDRAGAELVHLDVMDGVFVPNISFGLPVLEALRPVTERVFDVHLMIVEPERYVERFIRAGADIVTVHYEATNDPVATLQKIRSLGAKAALSIKPATPPEAIFPYLALCDMVLVMSVEPGFGGQSFLPDSPEKIRALRCEIDRLGLHTLIEVDGGINEKTAPLCIEAGVDILVAGSAVFGSADRRAKIDALRG